MASFTAFITLVLGALVAFSSGHPVTPVLQGFDAGALPEDGSPTGFPDTAEIPGDGEANPESYGDGGWDIEEGDIGEVGNEESGNQEGANEEGEIEKADYEEADEKKDDAEGDNYGRKLEPVPMEMTGVEEKNVNATLEASKTDVEASPTPEPKYCFLGIFC